MAVHIQTLEPESGDQMPVIHLVVGGKLTAQDYEDMIPELEQQIDEHGKIDLLVEFDQLEQITAGALWEDTRLGFKHFNHIRNLAVVGDKAWQEWLTRFAKPFTSAKLRYFQPGDYQLASEWVRTQ